MSANRREPSAGALAERELARAREQTRRFPALLSRKLARMSASPLAFLRGSATLFRELVGDDLAEDLGCAGEGFLVGDLHVENFGAFRIASPHKGDTEVVFDLNDFDDAARGPIRYDVLRLVTSALLAAQRLGAAEAMRLGRAMIEQHRSGLAHAKSLAMPGVVRTLLERAALRTRAELLDARTELVHGERRFVRGERYLDLPANVVKAVPRALEHALAADADDAAALRVVDVAQRVAGTGSLGVLRVAVLVAGKGGRDGHWIFEFKEARAGAVGGSGPWSSEAERSVMAAKAMLSDMPRVFVATELAGRPMVLKRLAPQEDRLSVDELDAAELCELLPYLGRRAGEAHRRGADEALKPWSDAECEALLARAAELAGRHVAVHLCFADRAR